MRSGQILQYISGTRSFARRCSLPVLVKRVKAQRERDTNRVRKWRGKCRGNKRASQQEGSKTKGKECGTTIFGHTAHRRTDNRRTIYLGAHCTALIPKKCSETCESEMRYITSTKMNTGHSDSKI